MKRLPCVRLFSLTSSLALLFSGCVINQARVPTRHFVLAPIPAPEHPCVTAAPCGIEVGVVKMPSYLLRDSMVVRKNAAEVDYLETALWAERLDESFRHTLTQNLYLLLASDPAYVRSPEGDRVGVRVSVNVQQFDVDTQGRGTLLAHWRLTTTGSNKPIKSGQAQFIRHGPSPRRNPQAIATTLSALVAEFGREIIPSVREFAQAESTK